MQMLKRLMIAAGVLAVASMSVSPALAAWGCQAKDAEGYNNFSWGSANEDAARDYTMKLCSSDNHKGCHIIECREGVDNQEQAYKIWSIGTRTTKCIGSAKC
jgi:hypothetical protein